jgi:alkane 1-monooxygenase
MERLSDPTLPSHFAASDTMAVAPALNSPKLSAIPLRRSRRKVPDPMASTADPSPPLPLAIFALASLLPVLLLGLGAVWGGAWLWLGFLYMAVLVVLIDQLVHLTPGAGDGAEFPVADLLLVSVGIGQLALLPVAVWAVAGDSGLTTAERAVLFLGTGFWLGQVAHPAAHELIHRPRREFFRLGATVYSALLFGHHASAHRLVHHRHVASPSDPNTARSGEGFYRFAMRAWVGSFTEGYRAEAALRGKGSQGQPVWMPHPYVGYVAGSLAALVVAALIAGLAGLIAWVGLALHAQSQILLSDYVQHYGLIRATRPDGRIEPVGPRHSWNTTHWFTSAMMLNAPRHSDHHAHPARPFPALRLPAADDAPRLPWPMPLACAIALVPRLWRRAIRPHLAPWRPPVVPPQDTRA